jgi:hypothetical protein
MATPERDPFDMGPLIELFPGDAVLAARLFVENDAFRNACEDLLLAKSTLAKLETHQETPQPTKIAEYRQLVVELKSEVAKALEHAR